MKYICLGYYDPARHAAMTEQEREAMFDECFEYDDHLRVNGHFVGGEALQPSETALTLYWKNGKVATTDGPYAETKEPRRAWRSLMTCCNTGEASLTASAMACSSRATRSRMCSTSCR